MVFLFWIGVNRPLMNPTGWFYVIGRFEADGVRLCDDGSAVLAGRRFKDGEAVDFGFGGHHAKRAAGPEQYLMIHRASGGTWCFIFKEGAWHKWAAAHRVRPWRNWLQDLVVKWGLAAPFLLLSGCVGVGSTIGAVILLCLDPWRAVMSALFTLAVVGWLAGGGSGQKT